MMPSKQLPIPLCQVLGRHRVPLLDAPFWLMLQLVYNFHEAGTYEVKLNSGEIILQEGRPAPDLEGQEWKTLYVYWEGKMDKPISSEAVLDAVTRAFAQAGIDARWVDINH